MNRFIKHLSIFASLLMAFSAYSSDEGMTKVTHAMGVTSVSKDIKRVVTLFQGATDSVVALGVTPVGVVDSWAQKPTYRYLRPALKGVSHVGLETQPNLEAIAALKPDLIIGTRSRHEKIYTQLSQIAPTVLAENVYDFQHSLELTAKAISRDRKGKELWSTFQERIGQLREVMKKNHSEWPISVSVLNIRADHLRLYLQKSFAGSVLHEVGFTFPLPSQTGWGVKLKTKEALPSANADMFFIILHSDDEIVRQNYKAWRSHPLWKALKAPQNGKVYEVDRVTWLLSGGIIGANLMLDDLYRHFDIITDSDS
ncbi:ABC transporter substrate-binding protein [Marinomonas mediterranea]|jgi:ABC-type Fe3+-citrate transport system, periplasmic component|uniref:ABC-type transporter, periplasmic subunit n=1 Tax=Marinomonas mediterranea (strain ATCC 700492 / JCM 21426 / NBRC 103028 / MMB-1) TaxID=717774 RepID=F2JYQ7_MARM1|nr:iron-siderophore ABC transporter substrate-binding protein [Marinomonas mediterranea]ADZ89682.1 ABC-type transporter, periplasmic subunit [Marinomonas mediterranea MMB-1]WCN07774.1 ABC transporter substrate-binding protein [Marinomonas mediterranea]WCN15918.1 ABC transporter substrate-binding protein [Marinomonas mediterranea MMB-1]